MLHRNLPTGLLVLALPAAGLAQGTPPECNNGGPYVVECQGAQTVFQLNGTGSFDPDGTPLTYYWRDECPLTALDDPFSPTPNLTVTHGAGTSACAYVCNSHAELQVTSGGETSKCRFVIDVVDTTAPALSLPPDLTAVWGIDEDPANTGFASAVDVCDANPTVTYTDTRIPATICSGIEEFVHRDWVAVDACGNQSTGTQVITLLSPSGPCGGGNASNLELDPDTCMNVIDTTVLNGFFTVELLGQAGFDVTAVDLESIRLFRCDVAGPNIWALRPSKAPIGDWIAATATVPGECSTYGFDGMDDATLTFRRKSVVKQLGLDQLPAGTAVPIGLTGFMQDGTAFWVSDMLYVQ